jgi:hypothetical protein
VTLLSLARADVLPLTFKAFNMVSRSNTQAPLAKGNIRLTNDGIIRFHGETSVGLPVGFTGTYVPELSSTLDCPGNLYGEDVEEIPGPHSIKGYVGADDLEIRFEDVSISIIARIDPHVARRINMEGSGRGNIAYGDIPHLPSIDSPTSQN